MKKIIIILILLITSKVSISQSISPNQNTEFCPESNITFTVTLPLIKPNTTPTVLSWTNTPTLISGVSNLSNGSNSTTFTFVGKFRDENIKQVFRVSYNENTTNAKLLNVDFEFLKIKSLTNWTLISSSCPPIQPNVATISAPICQEINIPISFPAIKWVTYAIDPVYCFGSISNYEYKLPEGWKIGNTVSNGSNWILSTNNTTITSSLLSGNGSNIAIRAANDCGTNLGNNQNLVYVGISRPNSPILQVNGSSSITIYCGDATAKTFTVQNAASCITSYEWITANKGWYDVNGNLITTNLITTTPSLTIAPSCNSSNPAQNIEVLMTTAGTEVFRSNKVTVIYSTNPPPLTITGPSEFCTSASYSVPISTNCGASIEWSLVPLANYPFPVTLSCTNCQTTTLTKLNGGTALLRATVSFPNCNTIGVYEKYIGVGAPAFKGWYNSPTNTNQPLMPWSRFDPNTSNPACYTTNIITSTDITANSTVVWSDAGNSGGVTWYQTGNNLQFYFSDINQYAFFNVSITNSCGTTNLKYKFHSVSDNCSGGMLLRVLATPNPTSNTINVELFEGEKVKVNKEIKKVKLIDKLGNVKKIVDYGNGNKKITMDISGLPTDIYNISVFDGKFWYNTRLIKN
jgi:hypothetical protein